MKKIRVLLSNSRPRIMREVMRQIIERQPDMEIVGEVLDPFALPRIANEREADVIIVALEDAEMLGLSTQIIAERPSVTILALASKRNAAFIEHSRLGRFEIAEPSETTILIALRQAIQAF